MVPVLAKLHFDFETEAFVPRKVRVLSFMFISTSLLVIRPSILQTASGDFSSNWRTDFLESNGSPKSDFCDVTLNRLTKETNKI